MNILIISDSMDTVCDAVRAIDNTKKENWSYRIAQRSGEALAFIRDCKPELIIVDADSRCVKDQILVRELYDTQLAGSKIILLRSDLHFIEIPELPANGVVLKAEIGTLNKIIFENTKERPFSN